MRILVAGDFCPQERVSTAFEKNGFSSVLGNVKTIVEQSDYSIVNFECPVCRGDEKPIKKCGPNLKCTEKGIEAIKWAGFKCVTLANNHFLDYGEEGVANTIAASTKNGLDSLGGGMTIQEAEKTLYKRIGPKEIAFINCCEHEYSIATETTAGSNALNPIRQYYAIKEAQEKADYVVVIVHGGHEMCQLPSLRMVETYRFFIDAGADVVINHHQHCYSGYEVYKDKPIFYGLGNFCFDEKESGYDGVWNYGYMLELEMDENVKYRLFPYKQCLESPTINMLHQNSFDDNLKRLNSIIANEELLKIEIAKYYESSTKDVWSALNPFPYRYLQALQSRGLLPFWKPSKWLLKLQNYILCESHRDKMDYFFNHVNK